MVDLGKLEKRRAWRHAHQAQATAYKRIWYAANRERMNAYERDRQLARRLAERTPQWFLQGGRCDLCGESLPLERSYWDHSHDTGARRGLLHNDCNALIVAALEDPRLPLGAAYLERWK